MVDMLVNVDDKHPLRPPLLFFHISSLMRKSVSAKDSNSVLNCVTRTLSSPASISTEPSVEPLSKTKNWPTIGA